jgi:hypothetical protein
MLYIVYGGGWGTPNSVFHKPLDKFVEVIELGRDLVQPLKNVGASIY